jgi:hypothetical protein
MIALFFLQTATDVKDILSIQSVSVIGLMIFFMVYLIWQNSLLKKDIIARDDKIAGIVAEHTKDLKEGNKDMITLVNKYHQFVEQLNIMSRGHHR